MRNDVDKRVILKPRHAGKTTQMLQWLRDTPDGVMVCATEHEAMRLREENPDLEGRRFVSATDARNLAGRRPVVLGVDNIDLVLAALLGHRVGAFSVNYP